MLFFEDDEREYDTRQDESNQDEDREDLFEKDVHQYIPEDKDKIGHENR